MTTPPYDLTFIHQFNLYQGISRRISEDDIPAIARVYGVTTDRLQAIEDEFMGEIAGYAARLRNIIPPQLPAKPYEIVAAGDSLTADRKSYANILRAYWEDTCRTIRKAGRSGESTAGLIGRFHRDVLSHDASHVILLIGTNDIGNTAIDLDEFTQNMEHLIDLIFDAGKQVVQVTLPPADSVRIRRFWGDEGWDIDPSRHAYANEFIRTQSHQRSTMLADLAAAIDTVGIDTLLPDGLHLNGEGQYLLAELIARLLP